MLQFIVTLKNGQGSRDVPVVAPDEWVARQVAIRQNVSAGNKAAWCSHVTVGRSVTDRTLDKSARTP